MFTFSGEKKSGKSDSKFGEWLKFSSIKFLPDFFLPD